ncbi:MAG TPA: RCC1 domain-containing protein [Pseudonocardiaceae bacterium]|nr:RCC1 domain-containing protein [Pseudonocardiaceae bacterium]
MSGLSDVQDVAAGQQFALALTAEGAVSTWGDDGFGEMGTAASSTVPVPVPGMSIVQAIGAGQYSGYAVVPSPVE